jgi:hypothetical protein
MRCSVIGASEDVGSSRCTTASSPASRPTSAQASGSANEHTMAGADASSAAPSATPEIMPVPSETTCWPSSPTGSAHVWSSPGAAMAVPTTATTMLRPSATSESTTLASSLATITSPRRGTRAKVTIPVRCDHSEVTSRIPTMGSSTLAGATAIASISRSVWSCAWPNRQSSATTATVSRTTANCSQKPARVSVILRSSTAVSRVSPGRSYERATAGAGWARVAVLMRPPSRSARSTGPPGPPPRRAPGA